MTGMIGFRRTSEDPAPARATPAADPGQRLEGRVRLRTLVWIRWMAVAGQTVSLVFVYYGLGFELPIGPAMAVVAASVLLNIVVSLKRSSAAIRLSDRNAALFLAYDIIQLAALLYLTGGLKNPFAILFLAPVAISATILSLRSTQWLGLLAVASVSLLALIHLPLPWREGDLALPDLYIAGRWVALVLGTIFIAAYAWRVAAETKRMSDALAATQMALAREQQLSALGALAAATAHELGTPLGTIAVVAKELSREFPEDSPLAEDVALLSSQAARCREILAQLSRRPTGEDDSVYGILPISALVETAAMPYRREGVSLEIVSKGDDTGGTPEPKVLRSPEIIHGLGNLVENAVDFAHSTAVVEVAWSADKVHVEVIDDGDGFAADILDALGEPYVTSRAEQDGMGLGVFIAKTLLARTGAKVRFANLPGGGAAVAIVWPRGILEAPEAVPREVPSQRDRSAA